MKHLLSILDIGSGCEAESIIKKAIALKKNPLSKRSALSGKTVGIIMEKPSTRTTVSFAVAAHQLGALPLILSADGMQRKRGETIEDTARTLSRYLDAVAFRTFSHGDLETFARYSSMSVINALTDTEHPCQALGDLMTIAERKKTFAQVRKTKIVFVGDGNNVLISWLYLAALTGLNFVHAAPKGYSAPPDVRRKTAAIAAKTGARISYTDSPLAAAKDAGVIYTDVWTSMGDEAEAVARKKAFAPYQVNSRLIKSAARDVVVMHCLPARRGQEITGEVIDGKHSIVFDQAENRLHIQKTVLLEVLATQK
ncbi:MAG: ornithine carbamoyltransferase [Elusimicrobia bacterium HGW-Elusimicrobia-1]|jgi:ornithine carbamoyltransferase|nr:MAG: ornithine carbamoyltransferase [Elusimicrobia bacterium HGW-Elusimicrobia-1]